MRLIRRQKHVFVFVLAALLFAAAGLFARVPAKAASVSDSQSTGVAATVSSVNEGVTTPVAGGGGGGWFYPPTTTPPTAGQAPKVTVRPDPQFSALKEIILGGQTQTLPVFIQGAVGFLGQTNILNALIAVEIQGPTPLRSSAYTDSNGNWVWRSGQNFAPGAYRVLVAAFSEQVPEISARATLDFYVGEPGTGAVLLPPKGGGLPYYIFVRVLDRFRLIVPGEQVAVKIKLLDLATEPAAKSVKIAYTVKNGSGLPVLETSETVHFTRSLTLLKTFYTHASLIPGKYTVEVTVPDSNPLFGAGDNFEVKGHPVILLTDNIYVDFTIVFQALLVLLLLFGLVAYFEYTRVVVFTKMIAETKAQASQNDSYDPERDLHRD